MVVCTSTIRSSMLPEDVQWPLCMRMFSSLSELELACTAAGLEHVQIDDSDSAMAFELPLGGEQTEGGADEPGAAAASHAASAGSEGRSRAPAPPRNRVHVGSADFSHLSQYDVNELCCRVVVCGRKPRH